jgi:putative DNA primase/helicase
MPEKGGQVGVDRERPQHAQHASRRPVPSAERATIRRLADSWLDIPAAQAYGAWDALHGASSPAAFSDAIKRTAAQHHGQAGRAFLEKLTFDASDLCAMLEEVKAAPMFATDGTEGQDKRAAARFALIGLAGELATDYGVTGWPVGAAGDAAAHGFKLWQSMRGKGNDERRQILQRVSGFIERHGDGRFSDADTTNDVQIQPFNVELLLAKSL